MKYLSIFFTVLLIWIATILMAFSRNDDPEEVFRLFLVVVGCTLVLFLIGFAKK